ncbi:MAG: glycosyltransferase family 4 protein [Maribacter sp.]|nr:glycosyltransferase family 4 protein [Maribacter sp.]
MKRENRILIHAPNLSTPGGKQTYFSSLLDHFESDIEFFFYGSQDEKETKLRVLIRLFKDYWNFYRLLRNYDYSLVHLNPSLNVKSFFRDSIFAAICTLTKTKMIVFWHGWQWAFERKTVRNMLIWFRMTYGKADSMLVLAKEFGDQLKVYGYCKPVYQVTTVADPMFFDLESKYENRTVDKFKSKSLTFLFLSRIEKVKGIYEVLESFELLKKEYATITLKVAGTGGELKAVQKYIEDKELQGVELLGWITGEEKIKAFSESDVYLLPSYGEGLPCSVLEAMAAGLPVITTEVGGIKDFFKDEVMGYLVKMKDPVDLSDKIRRIIDSPDNIGTMGRYNIEYARKRFTPQNVGSELERIYTETIKD